MRLILVDIVFTWGSFDDLEDELDQYPKEFLAEIISLSRTKNKPIPNAYLKTPG